MREIILLFIVFYVIGAIVWSIVVFSICITDKDATKYSFEETFLLSLFTGIVWPYSIYKCM